MGDLETHIKTISLLTSVGLVFLGVITLVLVAPKLAAVLGLIFVLVALYTWVYLALGTIKGE